MLKKLYTRSASLRGVLGKIVSLLHRHSIALDVHHIEGELNSLADLLSRTIEQNRYTLRPTALASCKLHFDFDLFGSAASSLAPHYCTALSYRARSLSDCPPWPRLSVAVPPWHRILQLLSEAAAAPERTKRILLVLPHWPAQPWWPLAVRLANSRLLQLPGKPWLTPQGKPAPHGAVALWVNG